jgi:hypothetical protein
MQEPKWKRFEKLVYEIQKDFAGDAEVKLNDSILGVDSQTERQIDISVRRRVGQYSILIVIDCKDYAESIDVKDMEAFAGMVKDVRANKGAMIVSSGFTEAALTLARNHGIDTFLLVDTASVDWKSYAALSCLLERTHLKSYSLEVSGFGYILLPQSIMELSELELRTSDGTAIGSSISIIRKMWDRAEIPRKPGQHDVTIGKNLRIIYQEVESRIDVSASAIVATEYYYGSLPIETRGLLDPQSGAILSKKIQTHGIEPRRIEAGLEGGWKKIEDPSQLSVLRPHFMLSYYDAYSEDIVPDPPEDADDSAITPKT